MKNIGKRREGAQPNKPKAIWLKSWNWLYLIVSISTYLVSIVSLVFTVYYIYGQYDPMRALGTGLLALLMAKMNQLNP